MRKIIFYRAEHVTLAWAPPEDDGGSPITGYQVRIMLK